MLGQTVGMATHFPAGAVGPLDEQKKGASQNWPTPQAGVQTGPAATSPLTGSTTCSSSAPKPHDAAAPNTTASMNNRTQEIRPPFVLIVFLLVVRCARSTPT